MNTRFLFLVFSLFSNFIFSRDFDKTYFFTDMVQEFYPGFYRPKTHLLGNYYAIFNDGKLVAVTGERFQNEDFLKITAVVSNIAFTGRGYAQQIMTFVNNKIISD